MARSCERCAAINGNEAHGNWGGMYMTGEMTTDTSKDVAMARYLISVVAPIALTFLLFLLAPSAITGWAAWGELDPVLWVAGPWFAWAMLLVSLAIYMHRRSYVPTRLGTAQWALLNTSVGAAASLPFTFWIADVATDSGTSGQLDLTFPLIGICLLGIIGTGALRRLSHSKG